MEAKDSRRDRGYSGSVKRPNNAREGDRSRQVPHRSDPRTIPSQQQQTGTTAYTMNMSRQLSDPWSVVSDSPGSASGYQTSPTTPMSNFGSQSNFGSLQPVSVMPAFYISTHVRTNSQSSYGSPKPPALLTRSGNAAADAEMVFPFDDMGNMDDFKFDDYLDWNRYAEPESTDCEMLATTDTAAPVYQTSQSLPTEHTNMSRSDSSDATVGTASQARDIQGQLQQETDAQETYPASPTRAKPGRKGRLSEAARLKAGRLRKFPGGSCSNCKQHKNGCDMGTPCRPCIARIGSGLLQKPCRGDIVAIVEQQLLRQVRWHPSARGETDLFGSNFLYTDYFDVIPISLGFGTLLYAQVRVLFAPNVAQHDHIYYTWPPRPGKLTIPNSQREPVLPLIFDGNINLEHILDGHLDVLVDNDFHAFPLYKSSFGVLRHIGALYKQYATVNHPHSMLLKTALKLLILVHIGGDASVDASDARVRRILDMIPAYQHVITGSCCLLRSQLGSVMPDLAQRYLCHVISQVAALALDKKCDNFLIVNSVFTVIMMTIETIQYHAAKESLHSNCDIAAARCSSSAPTTSHTFNPINESQRSCEEGARMLLDIYHACYENCHTAAFLSTSKEAAPARSAAAAPPMQRQRTNSASSKHGANQHLLAIREQIAQSRSYLEHLCAVRVGAERLQDMSLYFDRQLAKMYLLRVPPAG